MGEQIEKRWSRSSEPQGFAGSAGAPPEVAEAENIGDVHFTADNFASALEYYSRARRLLVRGASNSAQIARLDIKIADCHRLRGKFRDALDQLELAKHVLRSLGPSPELGKVYARQGFCVVNLGRYERGRKFLESAYKVLRPSSENEEIGNVELALGRVHLQTGDRVAAQEFFERALSTFRRIEYKEGIAHALNNLGVTFKQQCRWREAIDYFTRALKQSEEAGTYQRTAHCCLNLGIVHVKTGEWKLADQYFERSFQTYTDIGSQSGLAKVLLARGILMRRRHQWEASEAALQRALDLSRSNGYAREEVLGLEFLGELAHERGESEKAIPLLTEALARAETLAPHGDLVNEVLRRLGDAALAAGQRDAAERYAQRGLELSIRLGDLLEQAACDRVLGLCLWRAGEIEPAERNLEEALAIFARASERLELGRTHRLLAQFHAERFAADPQNEVRRAKTFEHFRASAEALSSLEESPEAAAPLLELSRFMTGVGLIDEAAAEIVRASRLESVAHDESLQKAVDEARCGVEAAFVDSAGRYPAWDAQEAHSDNGAGFERLLQAALGRTHSDRGALLIGSLENPGSLQSLAGKRITLSEARQAVAAVLSAEPTLVQGRPAIFLDPRLDARFMPLTASPLESVESILAVPLGLPGHPEGLLYLDRSSGHVAGPYRRSEFHLAQALAQFASLGLVEMQRVKLIRENRELRERLRNGRAPFRNIVTQNAAMQDMLRIIERVGESNVTVLLEGETGTGKGLIAEAIHRSSPRCDKAFVAINCAALPENLLESELFGHVQGAFTGAVRDKRGLFEEASGGTIFLDEVDKTSRAVQGKLLHVLDKREVRSVGANHWLPVDVRVLCATNADLMACIREGTFLEDLYYRLNDFVMRVPPLRERREDIPVLIDHFLELYSAQLGKKIRGVSREAVQKLMDHAWRGNVRELEKTIRRLVVLVDDGEIIDAGLLPPEMIRAQEDGAAPGSGATLREEIAKLEARMIRDALESTAWNKSEVARRLRMSYPSLLTKIRLYRLERRRR